MMSPANHFQLLLLLMLFKQCLAECSNNATSEPTSWSKKCQPTAKKYGLCKKGRGFCYRKGDTIEGKRLKCYDGLPCGCFPDVDNGYFVLTDPKDNVLGATAELNCYPGYSDTRSTTIKCKVNSTWSRTSRKCKPVDCGPIPSIQNGSYVTIFGTIYPAVGYVVCDEGFVLTYSSPDDAFLRCEENGVWNLRPVTCMPVDCGPIPSIQNGSYVTIFGTTYPAVGYMVCDEGFLLIYSSPEDAILRCEENGVWNFRPVTCMPVDCGNPPTPQHGAFNASSGTDYLSEAFLVCDSASVPANENLTRIVCESSGDWTAPQTICVPPGCPVAVASPLDWRPCVQISNMTLLVVSAHRANKKTALSNCQLVGDLARIDDPAKLSAFQDYLNAQPHGSDLWVQGGHDGSDWRFSNGDLMPNDTVMWFDADASSPCVALRGSRNFQFDDRSCSGYYRYICEISE